jgi:alkylation response protein AidB-like acyl-CoA dehydrogenase
MLAVPEELGGAAEARSPVTSVLIAEELARGDAGLAVACLAPLAVVNALVDHGTAEQQSRYLPAFAADEPIDAALALFEPQPLFDPRRPTAGAVATDGGWKLHGVKSMVPLGASAKLFLVAADVLGLGPRLFLVESDAPGLTVTPEPAMGLRAAGLCRLSLDGVEVGADAMLGGPGREGFDLGDIVDRARIGWGAIAVGASQAMLDYVIPYCNDRVAFGEPITHRQSVAFLIADMAIEIEGMRLMVRRAAARAEQGLSITREATLVKTQCAAKGMAIGTNGVQLLGGAGFIKDHPVERWYRHLRGAGIVEGALLV